jgi:putative flippase GtrA
MTQMARELGAAISVSVIALAGDLATLQALVALGGWHYLPAACAAFGVGTVIAYLLSLKWVFRFRRLESAHVEFSVFAAIGLFGLVINAAVIAFAVEALGAHYLAGKLAAASCTFAFNFFVRRSLLFTPAPRQAGSGSCS